MQGIPRPLQFRFFGLGRLRFVYKPSFQGKELSFKSSHILQYLQSDLDVAEFFPNKI